jgi:HlyD family secretion protein
MSSRTRALVLIVALLVAGIVVWRVFFIAPKTSDDAVALSGRIEGDDSIVGPKTNGRIAEKTDAQGRVLQAEAELATAEAELAQQEASLKLALFDRDAYTKLAQTGAVSERQGKQAATTAEQQTAVVAAAKRRVDASKGALTTARANLDNPNIRASQEAAVRRQLTQQQAEIAAAMASANQARFALKEAQANRQDLNVIAPFDGTVVTRSAEPGEVVTAGTAIITLLDLSKVYLRGFVPEGQIGRIALGQAARVYLDSKPNEAIDAVVTRVDRGLIRRPLSLRKTHIFATIGSSRSLASNCS